MQKICAIKMSDFFAGISVTSHLEMSRNISEVC